MKFSHIALALALCPQYYRRPARFRAGLHKTPVDPVLDVLYRRAHAFSDGVLGDDFQYK